MRRAEEPWLEHFEQFVQEPPKNRSSHQGDECDPRAQKQLVKHQSPMRNAPWHILREGDWVQSPVSLLSEWKRSEGWRGAHWAQRPKQGRLTRKEECRSGVGAEFTPPRRFEVRGREACSDSVYASSKEHLLVHIHWGGAWLARRPAKGLCVDTALAVVGVGVPNRVEPRFVDRFVFAFAVGQKALS